MPTWRFDLPVIIPSTLRTYLPPSLMGEPTLIGQDRSEQLQTECFSPPTDQPANLQNLSSKFAVFLLELQLCSEKISPGFQQISSFSLFSSFLAGNVSITNYLIGQDSFNILSNPPFTNSGVQNSRARGLPLWRDFVLGFLIYVGPDWLIDWLID